MGFGKGVSHLHCGAFSKYILFAINFIVFLIGVIILITGIVGQVKKQEGIFQDFNEEGASNWFKHASVLILVTGLVIMLISALGCCGAIKESKCLLLTYSTIMLIFFIIVLVGSIMALVFKDKAVETLQKTAERTLKEYDPAKADLPSTKLWNKIQTEWKCCGYNDYTDWKNNTAYNTTAKQVPVSCCKTNGQTCQSNPTAENAWINGCITKYVGDLEHFSGILGYIGLFAALIMLISIICAMVIGCNS